MATSALIVRRAGLLQPLAFPSGVRPRDQRPTLAEVGIDKKLSARSQKVGGIGEQAFEAMIENVRQRIADGGRVALDVAAMGL